MGYQNLSRVRTCLCTEDNFIEAILACVKIYTLYCTILTSMQIHVITIITNLHHSSVILNDVFILFVVKPFPYPQSLESLICFLSLYQLLYKRNRTILSVWSLASSIWLNALEIHPYCSMCLQFIPFLLLSGIPLYVCATVYLPFHQLKDIWVVSSFFQLKNKAILKIYIQVSFLSVNVNLHLAFEDTQVGITGLYVKPT